MAVGDSSYVLGTDERNFKPFNLHPMIKNITQVKDQLKGVLKTDFDWDLVPWAASSLLPSLLLVDIHPTFLQFHI